MTAKPTISLTDQVYAFAKSLVARGKFASLSAVVQHGLGLVEREEEKSIGHGSTPSARISSGGRPSCRFRRRI